MRQKQPTIEELLRRIGELEQRVKELEARPPESHVHYHSAPVYQPPYVPPVRPSIMPFTPYIGDPLPNTAGTVVWSGGRYQ